MPPAPKQSTKKPGAPKAKGAVRAKSGCYTCRIRRKKCDERQNQDGHCDTCVRLRLQCLGFGAKRPEWLRESRNVTEMRDKIKGFLAAQGMIKGHSGAAHRGSEQLPILQLEEDSTPSSSVSPPTPTLSLSPSEPSRPLLHESAMRDQHWISVANYSNPAMHNPMRGASPFEGSSHSSHPDMYPPSYNSPNSLAWTNGTSRLIEPAPRSRALVARLPTPPTIASSFGEMYHMQFADEGYYHAMPLDEDMTTNEYPTFFYMPSKPGGVNDHLVSHYLSSVMNLQYLLVDPDEVRHILTPTVSHPSAARNAARLLAAIHFQRANCRSNHFNALQDKDTRYQYDELLEVLQKAQHTEDDALAAISIISSFLFDGGNGEWQKWLKVSFEYACTVFGARDPREIGAPDPRDTLLTCNQTTRLIIKAAIWFDVLAAVTTQEEPRFLEFIRALYSPNASGIYDPSLSPAPELSMMTVMGCENHVVWALAEASALAVWKRKQQNAGTLSVPDLVARGSNLDSYLNAAASPPPMYPGALGQEAETGLARELSNNIFRAATRVYVRSIVSGDYPHVPEIIEAVDETLGYLRAPAQHSQKVHSSVVRSTVFGFFICGALSNNQDTRHQVKELLILSREDPAQSTVGNSASIRRLLDDIWRERRAKNTPLRWRDMLKAANILLV
ncbi:fungal-specific transcription factor domain-containing protein [Mycena sanguinolenta]|nr:fungal-specific transcription factor domain-containing protein [Mycena sanguinolenta]